MMIHSRRNTVIALFAVLIGIALGGAWWLAQDRASAQDILYSACEQTEAQQDFDFDGKITTEIPTLGANYNGSISGNNYSIVITLMGSEGGVLEARGVGGGVYYREDGGEWKVDETGTLDLIYFRNLINSKAAPLGEDVLCPEGAVASVGFESVEGVQAEHFTLTESSEVGPVGNVDGLPGESDGVSSREYNYWVGPDGLLVQTNHRTVFTTGGYTDVTSTISGVGDPNVIEKPAL